MITVDIVFAQDLPDDLKASHEIQGDDYSSFLIVKQDGEVICMENDHMEPEDATFGRDLKWIKQMLLLMYEIGANNWNNRTEVRA